MEASYRKTNPLLHYGILGIIYIVGALTLVTHAIMGNMTTGESYSVQAGSTQCNGSPAHSETIVFTKSGFSPSILSAQRCDEMIIKDDSPNMVLAALGPHEKHISYPGFKETILKPGKTYSFRLYEAGNFPIHDHLTDRYTASLNVK